METNGSNNPHDPPASDPTEARVNVPVPAKKKRFTGIP